MRYLFRMTVVLVVAFAVGWGVDRLIVRETRVRNEGYEMQVHLGAATGGLFAGAAAATLVGIGMTVRRKKKIDQA
jgi:hypothetical protein